MSDDLVQRLRNPSGDLESDDWVQDMWGEAAPSKKLREAAADRIEALETALRRARIVIPLIVSSPSLRERQQLADVNWEALDA